MNVATDRIYFPSTSGRFSVVSSHYYNLSTQVPSGDTDHLLFAGQTVSGVSLVLLSLEQETMVVTVNTEKIVLRNMLPAPNFLAPNSKLNLFS